MRQIDALPNGAAETALMAFVPPVVTRGCPGRKGVRCSATQMGLCGVMLTYDHSCDTITDPTPGPPPPCGLCKKTN